MKDERKTFLLDVFTTAIEGGISEWARVTEYHWLNKETDEGDVDGFYAKIEDAENQKDPDFPPSIIDRKVIQHGLSLIRSDDVQISSRIRDEILSDDRDNEVGAMDANGADAVVQIGLFGEIVYG